MLTIRKRKQSLGLIGKRQESKERKRVKQLLSAFGWAGYLFCCILLFWFYEIALTVAQQREEKYLAPYQRHHKYVEGGVRWTLEQAKESRKKLWKGTRINDTLAGNVIPVPVASASHQNLSSPYNLTALSWQTYEESLRRFSEMYFGRKLACWSRNSLKNVHDREGKRTSYIPRQLWQSNSHHARNMERSCHVRNPRASYFFLDELAIEVWMKQHFAGTEMMQTWKSLEDNLVIKNIFWRQLVLFVEGGYYADSSAICIAKIDAWANQGKSEDLRPLAIFAVSQDDSSEKSIQIIPWAFAGEPGHPIFLDAARRMTDHALFVRSGTLGKIQDARALMESVMLPTMKLKDRQKAIKQVETWTTIKELLTQDPFAGSSHTFEKGVLTEAVLSYVHCAYGFHWQLLKGINAPLQIGEVLFVPKDRMDAMILKDSL